MSRMTLSERVRIEAGIYAKKSLKDIAKDMGEEVISWPTAN